MLNIKFVKCRDVKSPQKAHDSDAGIDFYTPNDLNADDITDMYDVTKSYCGSVNYAPNGCVKSIIIPPHTSVLIPIGIKTEIPKGWCITFFNKSGIATKKHLILGSCVVDPDYRGEIKINLHNISNEPTMLIAGDKITQGLVLPIPDINLEQVYAIDENTTRGSGGFGSTGNT